MGDKLDRMVADLDARRPAPAVDLGIRSLAELIAEERDAPTAPVLIERVLMGDDYGVYAGKPKVGKTWLASDLAVSVATGTPWFGHFAAGEFPVLMFAGEGGRRRVLRRIDAVTRSRGIEMDDVTNLQVSLRAPVVSLEDVRRALAEHLERHPAALIIGEPFYLMGRGVGRGQLNEIGAVLGACQDVAQDANAALILGDHWNKGGTGIGADRITGAGMHEWSRVVINGAVEDTRTDLVTQSTTVDIRWDVSGEMPELGFKIRRHVQPDDPADPRSRLRYEVTFLGEHDPATTRMLSEDAMALLVELRARGATEILPAKSGDVRSAAAVDSRRASEAWRELEVAGRIDRTTAAVGRAFEVWITDEETP